MKYLRLLLVAILCVPAIGMTQNFSTEYGKLGKDEIEMKSYALDNTAEAVVLFDIGKSSFDPEGGGFTLIFERTTRIKILSDAGLKYAEVEIPFYQEDMKFEMVESIEANTYNFENGKLVKTPLNVSNYHDEKINDKWNLRKFALPDVKAGSIIEYKYRVTSPYLFNLRDWEFQWRIPVVYSAYQTKMVPFFEYTYLFQGAYKLNTNTSHVEAGFPQHFGSLEYNAVVYDFVMKNIPAFNDEQFITSVNDYISKLDFQLSKIIYTNGAKVDIIKSWQDLIKDMANDDNFGKYVKKSEKVAKKIFNLDSLSAKPPIERYNLILNYVKAGYSWNQRNGKFASKSPGDLITDKVGNCAEINLFAIGLLKAAGLDAIPVIISTRDNGKIKQDYPFSHFFDYVLISTTIEGKTYLTDATEIFIPNDRIPSRCINDKGLLINKEKVEWIPLQCDFPSELDTKIALSLSGFELNAKVEVTASEYFALRCRNKYGDNKKKISEQLLKDGYNPIDSTIAIKSNLSVKEPYDYQFSLSGNAEIINDKIYIQPFLKETISDNPFKQKTRTYPVDIIYPKKFVFNTILVIPDGYKVDYLPENKKFAGEMADYDYMITADGKTINITFEYNFKNAVFAPKDYDRLKFFYNEIIKKGNEKIVLVKNI